MAEQGHISIHADNILPIIKKWLYSEKEIFLRELISNSADALYKLSKLDLLGHVPKGAPEGLIEVKVDKEKRTLTVTDTGVGLTVEEIKKYINQVAFSGLHDFVEKYQDKEDKNQVIGHFGLGFYSAFMVADKIEIDTLSYQEGAKAVAWSCKGSTAFSISDSQRKDVGTSVVLHINDDSKDMLEEAKVRQILMKHCAFMKFPIRLAGKTINDTQPIWNKSPSQLTDKDYSDFFRKLFPMQPDPLFWIHIHLDFPFKLNGILYFPRLKHELDASQGEVKLFSNQVFVADNIKEILPEFLTLLKGALDIPDIPLNVSRSSLQTDPHVRKISQHIIKKVADRLTGLAKTDRENYEKYWVDIHPFVKFGMLREQKFYDRMIEHIIFKSTTGSYTTLKDYMERMKEQTDGSVVYVSDKNSQATYITMFKDHGLEAIIADTLIDTHLLPYIEMHSGQKFKFKRIDAEVSKFLINSEGQSKIIDPKDEKDLTQKIEDLFRQNLSKEKVKIRVENLKSSKVPAMLLFDESSRRMKEMLPFASQMDKQNLTEDEHTLVVNQNNSAIKSLLALSKKLTADKEVKMVVDQIYDLAYLQQGTFDSDRMQSFIARSSNLLEKLGSQVSLM